MKNVKQFLNFFLIFLIFQTHNINAQSNNSDLKRVWMLVEFQQFKRTYLVQLKAKMDLTNLKRPFAKMGCNNIGFQLKVYKTKLKLTKVFRSKMVCDSIMDLENEFCKLLPDYQYYKIAKHQLTLKNAKGNKMVFIAQDWD